MTLLVQGRIHITRNLYILLLRSKADLHLLLDTIGLPHLSSISIHGPHNILLRQSKNRVRFAHEPRREKLQVMKMIGDEVLISVEVVNHLSALMIPKMYH
jgi:hypothetical protein